MKKIQIKNRVMMAKLGLIIGLAMVALLGKFDAVAQTADMNYSKSVQFLIPAQEGNLSSVDTTNRIKTVTYFDEMGRPIQKILDNASPNGKDLVSHIEYDEFGRVSRSYLPYEADYGLTYQNAAQAVQDQASFYQSANGVAHDQRPYSEVTYDGSPFNRVVNSLGTGQAWEVAGRKSRVRYLNNDAADQVTNWQIIDQRLVSNGVYGAGQLSKSYAMSEDSLVAISFVNKSGQVVLQRMQAPSADGGWADTYSVYDDFGNLRFVLPPLALQAKSTPGYDVPTEGPEGYHLVTNHINYEDIAAASGGKVAFIPQGSVTINAGTTLNEGVDIQSYNQPDQFYLTDQIFQYEYDHRHRLIAKRVPEAGWEYMVYDARDRLVLTQTANQRADSLWSFVKYDRLNRPVITGQKEIAGDLASVRAAVAASSGVEAYDSAGLVQYTNTAYPVGITIDEILSVAYYDDYAFTNETFQLPVGVFDSLNYKLIPAQSTFGVLGLTTGSMVKISGTTDQFVHAVNFYDDNYRVVQTVTQNHKGGTDRMTMQYQWRGLLMKTYLEHQSPDAGIGTLNITQEYTYDRMGRHLTTTHQIGNGPAELLASNIYNALGQLKNKSLADGFDEVDYAYNIRGQITQMNNPDDGVDHLFEMAFKYQDATHAKFDGTIGEVTWKNPFETTTNGFDYQYDEMNRISAATGSGEAAGYDLSSISYDLNGNIKSLKRNGTHEYGTGQTIDDLVYTYKENTNRLTGVADASNKSTGFHDGNTEGDDYAYDANGNLTMDKNKGINALTYNHLNQPLTVSMDHVEGDSSKTQYTKYIYAGAQKVAQIHYVDSVESKRTDYIGGFVYENDTLQFIAHDQGRVVAERDVNNQFVEYEYQYHLTDHLGNIRVTFKTDIDVDNYLATMEDQDTTAIKAYFEKYDEVTRIKSTLFDHTTDSTGYALWLDGSADRRIGLAKSLMVMPGDTVDMEVFAKYYHNDSSASWTALLNTVAANIASGASDVVYEAANNASGLPFADFFSGNRAPDDAPKAYLNYLVFDSNYQIDSTRTGFQQISTIAEEKGNNGDHEKLSHQLTFDQPGYVYIYLSNEEDTPMDVFFDDFKVTQTHSPVVQKDDYYPFGLTFNSYSREAIIDQNFRFNGGSELEKSTGWYMTPYRKYDPSLGRFHGVDAMASSYSSLSPSQFAGNNPIMANDPTGLKVDPVDEARSGSGCGTCSNVSFFQNQAGHTYGASGISRSARLDAMYAAGKEREAASNESGTDITLDVDQMADGTHDFGFTNGHLTSYSFTGEDGGGFDLTGSDMDAAWAALYFEEGISSSARGSDLYGNMEGTQFWGRSGITSSGESVASRSSVFDNEPSSSAWIVGDLERSYYWAQQGDISRAIVYGASGASDALGIAGLGKAAVKAGVIFMVKQSGKRGLWQLTKAGASQIKYHKTFGTFYKGSSDNLWWVVDKAKHGGSHFKVFKETKTGLQWYRDADEFGNFILNKHKGSTGMFIPSGQLKTVY